MKTRICNTCKKELPLNKEYFYTSKTNKTGFRISCKKCMNKKSKENRQKKNEEIDKLYNSIDRTNLYKICSKCGKRLPATKEYFFISSIGKYYLRSKCKSCFSEQSKRLKQKPEYKQKASEYSKKKYAKNKEKYAERWKKYYKENAEYLRQKTKDYRKNNMDKIREWDRKNLLKPKNKINDAISKSMRYALNGKKNGCHWEEFVNYTVEDLKKHLEKHFKSGMTWDNYSRTGWHIDHIIPKSWFKFKSYNDREFKQCWALANLQPLWAEENLKKHNSYAG